MVPEVTLREDLIEGFAYDKWANEAWAAALPDEPRWHEIFAHIVWAQEIWLRRIRPEYGDPAGDLDRASRAWREVLAQADLDEVIDYTNLRGEPQRRTLAEIARHVINHGTYHRGHLRGLAEALGYAAFPETDLARYYVERP